MLTAIATLIVTHWFDSRKAGNELKEAHERANLSSVILGRADLTDVDLRDETFPDGSEWTPDTDMTQYGAVGELHTEFDEEP
jgi:uncharacterized protein YjbI with pentapeptide repeats